MTLYLARRVFTAIVTLLGVAFVTFVLVKSVPGDPVEVIVGEQASEETKARIRESLGLDRPFFSQFFGYVSLACRGDLGVSYITGEPVGKTIARKFPNTLMLAFTAAFFGVVLGILFGVVAATFRDTFADRATTFVSVLGISTPVYWLGLLLIFFVSYKLKLLPASGTWNQSLACLVLPALTLGTRSACYIARITRSSMLEVLSADYVRTARAKGLSEAAVVLKHSLKNSLIPIITIIGLDFGSYLNGSVLTETIFGWDGLGRYAMTGIMSMDYPVILGTVLVGAAIFVIVNTIVDVLYVCFNPQMRRAGRLAAS